jgi:hypothetical protein
MSIVSDRDRHLIQLGTETTIGTPSTQDKMFIRFSDQENIMYMNQPLLIPQARLGLITEVKLSEPQKVKIIF